MAVALYLAGDAWWESGATFCQSPAPDDENPQPLFIRPDLVSGPISGGQAGTFGRIPPAQRAGQGGKTLAPLHRPHLGLAGSCPGPALARVGKPKAQDLLSYGRYRLVPTIAASVRHGTKPSPLPPVFLFTTCTCLPASSLTTTIRRRHADLPTFVHHVRKWAFTILDSSSHWSITLPLATSTPRN